jgi:hypothetical protein
MPSGQNPWSELLASNRRRSKGDLGKLQRKLWFGIETAEAGLKSAMEAGDGGEVQRWIHCLTQISSVYAKVVINGDLETRIKRLEEARQ